MQMTDSIPAANPGVVFREMGDSAVLYNPGNETYYSLNEVGSHVWKYLTTTPGISVPQVVSALAAHYPDAASSLIDSDVRALVGSLRDAGLLVGDA